MEESLDYPFESFAIDLVKALKVMPISVYRDENKVFILLPKGTNYRRHKDINTVLARYFTDISPSDITVKRRSPEGKAYTPKGTEITGICEVVTKAVKEYMCERFIYCIADVTFDNNTNTFNLVYRDSWGAITLSVINTMKHQIGRKFFPINPGSSRSLFPINLTYCFEKDL